MNPNPPITSARTTSAPCRLGAVTGRAIGGGRRGLARSAAWAAAAALLAGCAHYETKVLRADPAFTDTALREGGLAVLGVTKVEEVAQVRKPLTETLERMLRGERADLSLVTAARAESALGERSLRGLLNAYQATGRMDDSSLAHAARAFRGLARYAVIARVESDVIRYSARGIAPAQTGPDAGLSTLCVTGRDARVLIEIQDLATGVQSFSAKYVGSSEDSAACREAPPGLPGGSGVTIGAGPPGQAPDRNYPDPPPLARALEEAFRNFARGLPRSAGKP